MTPRPGATVGIALVVLLVVVSLLAGSARADGGPITITPVAPAPGSNVTTQTPTIQATFADSAGTIDPTQVYIFVDGLNESSADTFQPTSLGVTYAVPALLKLNEGVNNVTITAVDTNGHTAAYTWSFTVNTNATTAPNALSSVNFQTILLYIGIGIAVAAGAFGLYYLCLRRTSRFAFRKYFATHPIQKKYLVIYVPVTIAFIVGLLGLIYVTGNPNASSYAEIYVVIIAVFIATIALGIDARRDLQKLRAYERAFAQFLFEMADAMRGGIAPEKAVVELSKTTANVLQKHLRIAADAIRRGRPFDAVLRDMVKPMKSPLISRYAGLIAEATAIGGETSLVVYRAAKDMDDFVKIEEERGKLLTLPVAVLYISFGVLMAVIFALQYIAPTLGTLNVGFISTSNVLQGATASSVPRLDPATLSQRFFFLMVIMSLGTGAIIGVFTEGRARYGILHALGLTVATAVIFTILFPPT